MSDWHRPTRPDAHAGMKAALELGGWVFLAPNGYLNARVT
jgi:hypothetical protein